MNYFEELKTKIAELVEDESKVNELVEFSKKSIPKEFIPKDKYNEKVEELTGVNEKLEETNKQIEELKNSTSNVDEYKEKLETLTQEYEQYKQEADSRVANMKKTSLLKDRLINEGADKDNIDLLLKDFNIDEMKLKDDSIIGLDDYVNPIKEKRQRLFVKDKVDSNPPDDGGDADNTDTIEENKLREAMGLPIKE
jgi:myosin heavy subunit